MRRLRRITRFLFHRSRVERDLDDEVQCFVEELVQRRIAAGAQPDEARRLAIAEIGSAGAVKDGIRDVLPGIQLDTWMKDIRCGWRALPSAGLRQRHRPDTRDRHRREYRDLHDHRCRGLAGAACP